MSSHVKLTDYLIWIIHDFWSLVPMMIFGRAYPQVNVPPMATPQVMGKKLGKGQIRIRKQAKPVYIRSHEEYDQSWKCKLNENVEWKTRVH